VIAADVGRRVVEVLRRHGYDTRAVRRHDPLGRLFFHSEALSRSAGQTLEAARELRDLGVLVEEGAALYATVRVVPYGGRYFVVDSPRIAPTCGVTRYHANRDGRYGCIGGDGVLLLDHVLPRLRGAALGKGLDLCTGSGIIGLTVAPLVDRMYAVDIDPAAIAWARHNAAVNACTNVELLAGDLYEPVADAGRFDVITANPSYSFFSPAVMRQAGVRAHEVADDYGLALVMRIIGGLERHLTPAGIAFVCTLTPIVHGEDYLVRRLTRAFAGSRYAVHVHYHARHVPRVDGSYYAALGISRFFFVFISVRLEPRFSLTKSFSRTYHLGRLGFPLALLAALRRHAGAVVRGTRVG
jgi:methylase of polypeptide subunit release factors